MSGLERRFELWQLLDSAFVHEEFSDFPLGSMHVFGDPRCVCVERVCAAWQLKVFEFW